MWFEGHLAEHPRNADVTIIAELILASLSMLTLRCRCRSLIEEAKRPQQIHQRRLEYPCQQGD
jgi:hypothetical protein